jgi:hypothetical protein
MQKTFTVTEKVWLYPGKAGWHFVTVPTKTAEEIDFFFAQSKKGWGSLPVTVTIGETSWKTSIFPDKKTASYLLPLKADMRKRAGINAGDKITFSVEITS